MASSNHGAFLALDAEKYFGQWVAIVEEKVVATSPNFTDAYRQAKKLFPGKIPFLAPVTKDKVFIL